MAAEMRREWPVYVHGGLRVDVGRRRVSYWGRYAALSPSEFRVLARLSGDGGNLVTQDDLLDALHGPEEYDSATIRPHMSRLRQKLEDLGADPGCIRTVRGEGYALEVDLL